MNSSALSPQKIRAVLIAACLSLLLTGCETVPMVTELKVELQRVPESLLVPCPISSLGDPTYQGAIELALTLRGELAECNRRLDDIRRWSAR
jgi:hypothetical protein